MRPASQNTAGHEQFVVVSARVASIVVAAAATLGAMLGYATPPLSSRRRPKRSTVESLGKIIEVHKERWSVLASEEHQRRFRSALEMTKVAGKERNAGELEN